MVGEQRESEVHPMLRSMITSAATTAICISLVRRFGSKSDFHTQAGADHQGLGQFLELSGLLLRESFLGTLLGTGWWGEVTF